MSLVDVWEFVKSLNDIDVTSSSEVGDYSWILFDQVRKIRQTTIKTLYIILPPSRYFI